MRTATRSLIRAALTAFGAVTAIINPPPASAQTATPAPMHVTVQAAESYDIQIGGVRVSD